MFFSWLKKLTKKVSSNPLLLKTLQTLIIMVLFIIMNTPNQEVKRASWFTPSEIDLAWSAANAANDAFDTSRGVEAGIVTTREYIADCDETFTMAISAGNTELALIATLARRNFELHMEQYELIKTSADRDFNVLTDIAGPYMLSPETPFDLTK